MDGVVDYVMSRGPYLLFVVLVTLGVYLMASHRNYFKAIIGLYLFQTSVIVFFVSLAFRRDGSIPIVDESIAAPLHNPLPQAMMLTAIVVGVATTGVAMSLLRRIQAETGSIEESAARASEV